MTPAPQASSTRPLWLGLFLLTAVVIGAAAGLLAYAGGTNLPTAILTGGGAFAGTTGLLLALAHYLVGGR
jgi:hypothetical protein